MVKRMIVGCGDVGQRMCQRWLQQDEDIQSLSVTVRTADSAWALQKQGLQVNRLDLDEAVRLGDSAHAAQLFYLVPPQKHGIVDERSGRFLGALSEAGHLPAKVVLLSTSGVYGDHQGAWVDESTTPAPVTGRAKRRLHAEHQWLAWGEQSRVPIVVMRVPGIYAHSRIPRARLASGRPVVRADQCGYSNRIHADDLVTALLAGMQNGRDREVYNVSDGSPGKMTDFQQAAASVLGMPRLPEISMREAEGQFPESTLSFLRESRRISNRKMLEELGVALRYPDFTEGLKHG